MGATKTRTNSKECYLDSEAAWEYIEMGRDLDDLYPEHWRIKHKFPANTLLKGEQHHFLEGNLNAYAITSFGRIFSFAASKPKQLIPSIYRYTIGIAVKSNIRINITRRMEILGWMKMELETVEYIRNIYNDNNWPHYQYEYDNGTKFELRNEIK